VSNCLCGCHDVQAHCGACCLAYRITRLESRYESFSKTQHPSLLKKRLDELENKIEKVEGYMQIEDRVTASHVLLRVDKLEEMQSAMLTMPNVVWTKYHKTPYKCPVCEGTRLCYSKDSDLSWQCESCEGKGIVWG